MSSELVKHSSGQQRKVVREWERNFLISIHSFENFIIIILSLHHLSRTPSILNFFVPLRWVFTPQTCRREETLIINSKTFFAQTIYFFFFVLFFSSFHNRRHFYSSPLMMNVHSAMVYYEIQIRTPASQ